MSEILIKNGTVVTLGANNKVLKDHAVLIRDDKIEKIAPQSEFTGNYEEVVDASGKLVMPGFICGHMHFYSSFARGLGKAEPAASFSEVLENLWWRLDKKLSIEDSKYSALVAMVDGIKHGTTTFLDHHASPYAVRGSLMAIADAVKEAGVRASLCYEVSDRDGDKIAQEGIDENIDFIKWAQKEGNGQLHGLFGMHAQFTIGDKTMEKSVEAAKAVGAGFHIHTAEAKSDQDHCEKEHGMRVVERLHKFGVTGPQTICAHCVHVNDKELQILKDTDTNVVHNPQSNMNNAVGVADILKMNAMGIPVGLGTDAMTTNMMEELRACMWIHKLDSGNPAAGFMETVNALALHNSGIANRFFNNSIGVLEEGRKADVILVDYYSPTELSDNTFYGHLVFGIPHSTVDTTIANGKFLMRNKKLQTLDEEKIMAEAHKLSTSLWDRF
jgi:putative selenium metabolism protein SsnA